MEWPLTISALIFFFAYAYEILANPVGTWDIAVRAATWITWGVFLVDYVVRLTIAEHRWRWFYRHILDLAIVVLPMLRPLRLMRFFTILAIIQRGAGAKFRGRVTIYVIGPRSSRSSSGRSPSTTPSGGSATSPRSETPCGGRS